jgi:hypothetical protein
MISHNAEVFNDMKYKIKRKRPKDWQERQDEETKKRENNELMMIMDEVCFVFNLICLTTCLLMFSFPSFLKKHRRDFYPKFNRLSFVEDWKKKKAIADAEPVAACDKPKGQKCMFTNARKFPFLKGLTGFCCCYFFHL